MKELGTENINALFFFLNFYSPKEYYLFFFLNFYYNYYLCVKPRFFFSNDVFRQTCHNILGLAERTTWKWKWNVYSTYSSSFRIILPRPRPSFFSLSY